MSMPFRCMSRLRSGAGEVLSWLEAPPVTLEPVVGSTPVSYTIPLYQRCRSCRAEIVWCRLNGKPHPVDRKKVAGGNLVLMPLVANGYPEARVVPSEPGVYRYQSHFASCKDSAKWRRRR